MSLLNVFKPSSLSHPNRLGREEGANGLPYVRPRYEIAEEDHAYFVDVDLPGVSKKALSITVHDGLLEIVGKRSWKTPEGWKSMNGEPEDYAYRLRLMVGDRVDETKIQAAAENGVLRLTLPKEEEKRPRQIEIR